MRIFVSSDMEGTAGVVDWSQCLAGQPEYEYYRTLLQREVNAAIEDIVVGESGINSLLALAHAVPVVLITGDDITAAENAAINPLAHAAIVKTALNRFAADSLHPDAACALIRDRAQAAVDGLADAAPLPAITLPATLSITFRNADLAELASWVEAAERTGATTVHIRGDDPLKLYRSFVHAVLLTRELGE